MQEYSKDLELVVILIEWKCYGVHHILRLETATNSVMLIETFGF